MLLQPRQWKPIIKLRTSNHYLPVETGRWNNTERHERKCTLCNENELGDEYHYILCVITSEMKEICCYQNITLSVITC